jgi:predicted XRE-type DNA-binding protein
VSIKKTQSSGSVFKDLGFSDYEAEKLAIKSTLMIKIEKYIKEHNLTQEEASKILGIGRSRVSDVVRGKIDKITIDALVDMLSRAGYHMSIIAKKEKVAA